MSLRTPIDPEAALSLALAVIAGSNAPVLLLNGDLNVIAASRSFCRAFDIDPASVRGCSIFALGGGEWDVPQLRSLLTATLRGYAEIEVYEMELRRDGREVRLLVLNAQKLDYADGGDSTRLVLAVSDVTVARANDKLNNDRLREKVILLQELQHRVANSLQIVASVLLQSARGIASQEARGHLFEAHQRVMSVAAVQRQLANSSLGEVQLGPYFNDLCQSLSASMISDHNQLSLEVSADDSSSTGKVSVSLGLITTELVINALKHAFPAHRNGKIEVAYRSHGPEWALTVADNGIGFPADGASVKSGLGTGIVEALAKQLNARIQVTDANPGVSVSIAHGSPVGAAAGLTAAAGLL
jgi:two-component sensor histidine kinase